MKPFIIKASGEKEPFDEAKVRVSFLRSGASESLAGQAVEVVKGKTRPGISSKEIYNQAREYLLEKRPEVAVRYSLKSAIMKLGPAGFLFEKYVARILKEYGYQTRVGQIVKGYCVNHEIDVIALKNKKHFMVECKYHNRPGIRSDLKVALYTYGRFLDVEKAWKELKGHKTFFHQAWLVTNTKCTSEAVKYARCINLRIIAWRYPQKRGLEYFIENKGLYPVTVLSLLPKSATSRLGELDIVLARDLLGYSSSKLARLAVIPGPLAQKVQKEVRQIWQY